MGNRFTRTVMHRRSLSTGRNLDNERFPGFFTTQEANMTTTVHIAVSGNKQVLVTTQAGQTRMQPGSHHTFSVHGDGEIGVKELGEFVHGPDVPLVRPYVDESGYAS